MAVLIQCILQDFGYIRVSKNVFETFMDREFTNLNVHDESGGGLLGAIYLTNLRLRLLNI